MRATLRIGLWIVQIAIFLGIVWGSIIADPHFNTDTYAPGAEPHRLFPVVAVRAQDRGSTPVEYRLIRWSDLEETRLKEPLLTFQLPASEGHFELPQSQVNFTASRAASDGQLVEVFWTGDYVFHGKYFTDGISIRPLSLYVGGMTALASGVVLVGSIAGLVAAWLVGWLVRRRWFRNFDAPKLPPG